MSLILDALRRADAERERGAVPGLHAQPMAVPSPEPSAAARLARWGWVAVIAVVATLAVLGGMLVARTGPAPSAPAVAAVAPAPPSAVPAAPAASAAIGASPPAAAPPPTTSEPRPVAEPAPWTSPEPRKAATSIVAAAPAPPPPAASAQAPQPAPAETPVLRREQLPENLRAQLPPLAVGGSIYSSSAADRSLIVDGRIYRENDRLSPDLVLERIGPKAAVLQIRGVRFEIAY